MKLILKNNDSGQLDTEKDTCLYRAQRGGRGYLRGRDLYLHQEAKKPPLYYVHRWTLVKGEQEGIGIITPAMAGRFLENKGIFFEDLVDQKAAMTLRSWGYGILEEF